MEMHDNGRAELVRSLVQFRRAIWRDFALSTIRAFGDFDFSLVQVATLLLLEEEGEPTIKQVAEQLGRSVSATGRLLDHLVQRGLVSRREDERDRRLKRVAITEPGRQFLAALDQRRADAQLAVMEYLSAEEQAAVVHAMALLAAAGRRSRDADRDSRTTGAGRHPGPPVANQ